ncbi:hypothetical protein [Nocardioides convexus]|uniref:hypothetical protein n=1 Tax=Nocardioides convexus TaxID=2712224 RepID=UPI002418642A|nr:hypothetical protein [Nocardioides convexus]
MTVPTAPPAPARPRAALDLLGLLDPAAGLVRAHSAEPPGLAGDGLWRVAIQARLPAPAADEQHRAHLVRDRCLCADPARRARAGGGRGGRAAGPARRAGGHLRHAVRRQRARRPARSADAPGPPLRRHPGP